jgi:hypothetical protein
MDNYLKKEISRFQLNHEKVIVHAYAFMLNIQQQFFLPQPGNFRSRSHSLIIPEAQPTPASTCIAATGQFLSHAPHSMHASRSPIFASLSLTEKT